MRTTAPRPGPAALNGYGRLLLVAVALIVAVLGSVLAAAAPAGAHAALTGSDPKQGAVVDKAPEQVSLTFSEKVAMSDGSVRVLDPAGKRVDTGKTTDLSKEVWREPVVNYTSPERLKLEIERVFRDLDASDEEGRVIVINLPGGESLQEHQVHERAWLVVVSGSGLEGDWIARSVPGIEAPELVQMLKRELPRDDVVFVRSREPERDVRLAPAATRDDCAVADDEIEISHWVVLLPRVSSPTARASSDPCRRTRPG